MLAVAFTVSPATLTSTLSISKKSYVSRVASLSFFRTKLLTTIADSSGAFNLNLDIS